MDRRAHTSHRRPWRAAVAVTATLALVVTPGLALGAEDDGGHSGGHSGGGGGMGGGETGPGNNLAMPVIWAELEGVRPTLRGVEEQDSLPAPDSSTPPVLGTYTLQPLVITPEDATYVMIPENDPAGIPTFLQKQENNEWQAESTELADSGLPVTADGRLPVTYLDWGDNLGQDRTNQKGMVRVQTKLTQHVSGITDRDPAEGAEPAGMTGYLMNKVGGSQTTEMWGVAATQTPSVPDAPDPETDPWSAIQEQRLEAFVYTSHACLTIERIDRATSVSWDPESRAWTEDGDPVCVGDVTEGPGGYGAEVTVSGGVTYGYVWHAPGVPAGLYRLTFSLKPGSGVDIAPSTTMSPETTDDAGSSHKPSGAGEDEAATTTEEDSSHGGETARNTPVFMPGLDLSYIDFGLSYDDTKPTPPLDLTASRGVDAITLSWAPPVSSGASPITGYVVTGVRQDDGAALPEQRIPATGSPTASFTGLAGGEPYRFTVRAENAQGTGSPATLTATPRAAAAPPAVVQPAPVQPPVQVAPAPPTAGQKVAKVRARAIRNGSKLRINVNPNRGRRAWEFVVLTKSKGVWTTLPKVYETRGPKEKRTLNLGKGKYRVVVLPRFGYSGVMSEPIRLKR